MVNIKQFMLAMLVALANCLTISAEKFEAVNDDGVTIYYDMWGDNSCAVISKMEYDDYYSPNSNKYSGHISIPSYVEYDGRTYKVTCIKFKAFEGCTSLESIEIPNTVDKILPYAFSDCI